MLAENGFWYETATQGHSRSLILQSVIGRQGVAYLHIILLVLCWNFRRSSHLNHPKFPSSTTPTSFDVPAQRNPCEYPHTPLHHIFPETRDIGLHFLLLIVSSFKFVPLAPKDASFLQQSAYWAIGPLRSPKVDNFGTNRKRVCDFLLIRHSDYGAILHRF